ncbi:MAG: histidinol-phosphatase HisJ family protein [Clostridiales bacterium]|jgi:histidinol-phosphatase (PHP family)|nr:histidinol-phosphatase HisJ family protein [Clostridiales bacterium]
MIKADFHVHSEFSSDGKSTMEEMINQGIKLGLETICFTDHMDYDYPSIYKYSFQLEIDDYLEKLKIMKDKYKSKIEILTGIELGIQPHVIDRMNELVSKYSFDFIIGSVHVVDQIDPYYPEYWENRSEEEGILRCFKAIKEGCESFQGFNVCGHIDYIIRYTPSTKVEYNEYSYPYYADVIDEILETLIKHGKGIELNTSGYKYGLGHPHPKTEILKRYKELGGEIITIGSDAHLPEHLCFDFERAANLLKSIGYDYYTTFKEGKPIMKKI